MKQKTSKSGIRLVVMNRGLWTIFRLGACLCVLFCAFSCNQIGNSSSTEKPNILLIVADDLGYADLGCFGSDIHTPNIDQLAFEGLRFTHFYANPSCPPSRASILTGANNHVAGLGSQFRKTAEWGYEGYLSNRVVTVPQLLEQAGYQTYMAGKWHLGGKEEQLPHNKGFGRSFVLHEGAGNHYNDIGFSNSVPISNYSLDGEKAVWPTDGYSTEVYTNYLIDFISDGLNTKEPFFAFAAYTAPHWPLQVDEVYRKKYEGRYDEGYEVLQKRNIERLQKAKIINKAWDLPPRYPGIVPWDSLSNMQKKIEARKMELYAGMVENLDFHIGRLLAHLKSIGEYENTMIVFVSDNGAAAAEFYSEASIKSFLDATYDNSYENMGSPSSFVYYDKPWAEASSALFRNHKQYTYEGGIRVPAIIKYPNNEEPNGIHHDFSTVADLAPTFYEVAGITYPEHYEGQQLYPLQGKSLIPLLSEGLREIHDPDETWVMEHNHHILVRQGAWKLVNPALGPEVANFSLFNLETDLIESEDLKTRYPEKFKELMSYWNEFKKNNHIQEIPLENQE